MNAVKDYFFAANVTKTAGTAIAILMQGKAKLKAIIGLIQYLSQGTAHNVTVMKPIGRTTLASPAAASQAVINLTADPSLGTDATPLAVNQYVVLEQADGSPQIIGVISSVTSLAVTLTANLAAAIPAGKKVWFFGLPTSADHTVFPSTASTSVTFGNDLTCLGIAGSDNPGDPLIVYSANGTAAGTVQRVAGVYADTGRIA